MTPVTIKFISQIPVFFANSHRAKLPQLAKAAYNY